MSIFSFFRKRKEKLNIEVPVSPVKSLSEAHDNEIYYERAPYDENKYNLEDCENALMKSEKILKAIQSFEEKYNEILYKYYFLKMFSQVALRDKNYNEQMVALDKQTNRLKKNYNDIKKRTDVIRYIKDSENYDYEAIYLKINELFEFSRHIETILLEVEKTYYQGLKIATYNICKGKTYQELEILNRSIIDMVREYKTFQEAHDYIYFNSSEAIVRTIKALVKVITASGITSYINEYPFHYFLSSDDVVVLRFVEWIDLFNKILYCIRKMNKIDVFSDINFSRAYHDLEKRYIIILLYNETDKKL